MSDGTRTKATPAGRLRVRTSAGWAERVGTAFAVIGVLAFFAVILIARDSSSGIGSRPRSAAEQRELLANGDCALHPNHTVAGKVAARLGPTRLLPSGGYLLEGIDRHRIFQVQLDEVTLVPCTSLAH